jgi:hypothetical protein
VTFIARVLSEGLRLLMQDNLSSAYHDVSQMTTAICERMRFFVLYFFIMNVGILAEKLKGCNFEELQLRMQKYKRKWKFILSIFLVGEICVLTLIVIR